MHSCSQKCLHSDLARFHDVQQERFTNCRVSTPKFFTHYTALEHNLTKLLIGAYKKMVFASVKRKSVRQLIHYGVFGISRNMVGYMVYLLITYLGAPPKIATSLLYLVGATVSFFGNRRYIFSHKGSLGGAGIRYLIVHSLGYLINISMFILLVDMLGYPHQWVQIAAIFVVAGFLFIAFKYFVFRDTESRE